MVSLLPSFRMLDQMRLGIIAAMNSIFVKEARDCYRSDQIEIVDGYQFSQYLTLRTIDLYSNSQSETGRLDRRPGGIATVVFSAGTAR
jgi:hypothetical protein